MQATNVGATFADQMSLATNACGPTALLNSLRAGDAECQAVAASIPGITDAQKLRHIILRHGARPSKHIPSRIRWSKRGINPSDLTDVANEVNPAANVSFHLVKGTGQQLIQRTQQVLARSLRNGFPPIICIRRYKGAAPAESHFISLVAVSVLVENASTLDFTAIDPAGGKKITGTLTVDPEFPHALRASIPSSRFVKNSAATTRIVSDALILRL